MSSLIEIYKKLIERINLLEKEEYSEEYSQKMYELAIAEAKVFALTCKEILTIGCTCAYTVNSCKEVVELSKKEGIL